MSATRDIEIEQGATFSLGLICYDADGEVIDTSSWTFRGQVRRKSDSSGSPAAAFTCVNGSVQDENGDNQVGVLLSISATITAAIACDTATSYKRIPTKMIYDIEAVRGDGSIVRVLQGTASISPEVTR